jgi:uncharacterized repeat protein (TIGR03803 family)
MKSFSLGKYAFSGGVAVALLAGCGGAQPPVGAPQGSALMLARSIEPPARRHLSFELLYHFKGDPDGDEPYAGLILVNGTLYGTTFHGGTLGAGTVFAITKAGKETVLHSFGGPGDGKYPDAGLVNVNGTLYGTTDEGGANPNCNSGGGCGTVFAITTTGTETVLHSFKGGSGDGEDPQAGLVNVNGTLYGTTIYGGANGVGTVFAITTTGTETVLHSFDRSGDGRNPDAGLVNVNGTIYGTTVDGGAKGLGTVFAITTTGTETVLHSFGAPGDGESPWAGLLNVKGTLYGTTENGGANDDGTVFSITTSGNEIVLHSLSGCPVAGLVNIKGALYGTTSEGGANGAGTVFSLTL